MKLYTALFGLLFTLNAHAGPAIAVSADDAQQALAQGATAIDVRAAQQFAAGHLALAVSLPQPAVRLPLDDLAALLSQAGIDSSRTMLVVGEAGDANAQALWQRLAQVTSGRVLWLVGGVPEWQMRGYALTTQAQPRLPVPQFLAPFGVESTGSRMAGSKVRSGAWLERPIAARFALN